MEGLTLDPGYDLSIVANQAPPLSRREAFRGLLQEYRAARGAGDSARVREVRGILARLGAAQKTSGRRAFRGQAERDRNARI
ncbi:MAG: hypothetical protein WKF75_11005 [Singulisphaera sp.]